MTTCKHGYEELPRSCFGCVESGECEAERLAQSDMQICAVRGCTEEGEFYVALTDGDTEYRCEEHACQRDVARRPRSLVMQMNEPPHPGSL